MNPLNGLASAAAGALLVIALGLPSPSRAVDHDTISLSLRNVQLDEVMDMLSRTREVNILVADGVDATISVNLYNVGIEEAIRAAAAAGGYAVERRGNAWYVVQREDVGQHDTSDFTILKTFKVQYSDTQQVADILNDYSSSFGSVTALPDRNVLVVEDRPQFVQRIGLLLTELDREPTQVLIEAEILEISLDDGASYGIDWRTMFSSDDGTGTVGTRDLATTGTQGLFLEIINTDFQVFIDALVTNGRARTLSSPKLLALEDQEAQVIVGDRKGYRETTTINQVTTESIRFLESGVILRVTPSVDGQGRILLTVRREIYTGTVVAGIPNQTTTEVTTQLLLEDGQTSFIGGLIKRTRSRSNAGIPGLSRIPIAGRLFRNQDDSFSNTETVVLIKTTIVQRDNAEALTSTNAARLYEAFEAMQMRP